MRLSAPLRWLTAPAVEPVPRLQAGAAAALRILVGLLWLYNVAWKRAPDFGQEAENGLFKFTSYAVSHPVFPPYSWVVENIVLKAFTPFGWMVLLAETTLAVLLLTGSWVRLAAVLGLAQSVAIGLSVAFAPEEWPWSYWLMIGAHGLLLFSSAGRVLAVDGVRAGVTSARRLGQVWGWAAVVVAAYSVVASLDDPLAPGGPGLASSDWSLSLGRYNLVGGVVLALVGALLVAAAHTRTTQLARAAAVVAALAGLSLHAQLGFSDPILGGNATSAAVYFSVALVGLAVSWRPTPDHGPTDSADDGTGVGAARNPS